jgi:hypothetical protein
LGITLTHFTELDATVALPPGIDRTIIRRAVRLLECQLADCAQVHEHHPNGFASVVRHFGIKALAAVSTYERHPHPATAQQRFPDLRRRGAGPKPAPNDSLESKASKRPWAIQSHYDHPGWYIVWRYLVDPTETLEPGRPVVIWRVDVVFLGKSDWKYEKSGAGERGGGRTHTFGVRNAAQKLGGKAVYQRRDVVIRGGKPIPRNGFDA